MKQEKDKFTADILSGHRPVGRPPKLDAQSPADRQRARRARLKAEGVEALTLELPSDVLAALRKYVQFKDETNSDAVTRILRDRLMRKR